MDEEFESAPGASMLPIALAVLAIALGAAGLYFGITASQQLTPLSDSVDAGTSSSARLEKQLGSIVARLDEIAVKSDQLEKTVERLRLYGSQNERAVKQVASASRSNRQELVNLAESMSELAERIASGERAGGVSAGAPSGTDPAPENDSSGSAARSELSAGGAPSESSESSDATTYRIQSGDTFARIATRLGISLNALLDANPDVDTRRLQIGQLIQLPESDG